MTGAADGPPRNQRHSLRVPVRVEVRLGDRRSRVEYAINLSPGGVCLQTTSPEAPGARLRVAFVLGPGWTAVETEAEVVWCMRDADRGPGLRFFEMGLRFLELKPSDRELVERFVDEVGNFWPDQV